MSSAEPTNKQADRSGRSSVAGNPFAGFLLPFCVAALVAARMLVPTESGPKGDTLWITQAWFVVGLMWSVIRIVKSKRFAGPDLLDLAVWLIVIGHVVSAVLVINGQGHKRAAMNMLWEWLALGVSFTLLRQCVSVRLNRRQLTLGIVSIVFSLSLLGLWQHFVFYKQAGREYSGIRTQLDEMIELQRSQPDPGRALRIRELGMELQARGASLDGPDRILFEQRLQSSSEPFGPFALANSFGGLMCGWLVVLLLGIVIRRGPPAGWMVSVLLLAIVGWVLVLTKSRTAWVGTITGCVLGFAFAKSKLGRKSVLSLVAVGLLVGSVVFLGNGLDREVISEAPKSLKYRMEYWLGSIEVVKSAPVFGIGPGNFRQHYLQHKLPESSEEISDPHNLILDAWVNGGLLAIVGLTLLVWCVLQGLTKSDTGSNDGFKSALFHPISLGLGFGFLLVTGWDTATGEYTDSRFLMLMGAYILTVLISSRLLDEVTIPSNVFAAAAVALLVALLGSGGFGMPAIMQCLLIFVALRFPTGTFARRASQVDQANPATSADVNSVDNRFKALMQFVAPALMLGLVLGCLLTTFVPVIQSRLSDRMAKMNLQQGRLQRGMRDLQRAIDFDPLNPEGYQQLAAAQWQTSGSAGPPGSPEATSQLQKSVTTLKKAVDLDPINAGRRRMYAGRLVSLATFDTDNADQLRAEAAAEMRVAVDLYPNSAEFLANLAVIQSMAGLPDALGSAEKALQLDQLNRTHGHRDKYLPDELLKRLTLLAKGSTQPAGNQ